MRNRQIIKSQNTGNLLSVFCDLMIQPHLAHTDINTDGYDIDTILDDASLPPRTIMRQYLSHF